MLARQECKVLHNNEIKDIYHCWDNIWQTNILHWFSDIYFVPCLYLLAFQAFKGLHIFWYLLDFQCLLSPWVVCSPGPVIEFLVLSNLILKVNHPNNINCTAFTSSLLNESIIEAKWKSGQLKSWWNRSKLKTIFNKNRTTSNQKSDYVRERSSIT